MKSIPVHAPHSVAFQGPFTSGKGSAQTLLRLDSNENPYGVSPAVQQAILAALPLANRYVFSDLPVLTAKIAARERVSATQVLVGAGLSDLLEKTALLYFKPGDNLVCPTPTFPLFLDAVVGTGAQCKSIACRSDGSHDLEQMEAAIDDRTRMVYICNPNNPTGSITKGQALLRFCESVSPRVPIFIDEAYLDLAVGANTQSMVSVLLQKKNVIIGRTFSKGFGLAGLRIGYLLAQPAFLAPFHQVNAITGLNISSLALYAASAALDDVAFHLHYLEQNERVKRYVYSQLNRLGYAFIPSYTNFILMALPLPGDSFQKQMLAKGIRVKTMEMHRTFWCRLSLGTLEEMQLFVKALGELQSL